VVAADVEGPVVVDAEEDGDAVEAAVDDVKEEY
jgi:hypothetical protein